MRSLGKLFSVLLVLSFVQLCVSFAAAKSPPESDPSGHPRVIAIRIDGTINPASADYLRSALAQAEEQQAKLLLIRLNTPGGLIPSMKDMVADILESKVPVVVYVSPSGGGAMSAGVFLTLAAHVAVMAPGTNIGAAHPVGIDGQDVTGDMRAKLENDAASQARSIALQRNRNAEWAERAVRESISATDREAVDEKVVDFIASDEERLFSLLEGRTVTVRGEPVTLRNLAPEAIVEVPMNFRQHVVNVLADPTITVLLWLGALLGIGIEMYHPGGMVPGIIGVICLILALTAAQVLPLNYGGIALLLLGGVFFAVELFMPTFGVWGIAGIVCLVLGSIYLVDTEIVWSASGFEVNQLFLASAATLTGALLLGICYLVIRTNRRQVATGVEGLINKTGVVVTEFSAKAGENQPLGTISVMGELWKARLNPTSSGELPKVGERVRVVRLESGMVLVVES